MAVQQKSTESRSYSLLVHVQFSAHKNRRSVEDKDKELSPLRIVLSLRIFLSHLRWQFAIERALVLASQLQPKLIYPVHQVWVRKPYEST